MIPNALASTGAYAGLWSYLKSIEHALDRALEAENTDSLTELDRERLMSLASFLESGVTPGGLPSLENLDLSKYAQSGETDYASAIDLRTLIAQVGDFEAWMKSSKMGLEKKVQRLVATLRGFVSPGERSLFHKDFPVEELDTLRAIVQTLLSDAEAALHL